MTTPNRDAFKDKKDFERFKRKHSTGFNTEQLIEALNRPQSDFHDSPNNPWNQLKKEQEEREEQ
jgi:hypothetical protein